MISILDYGMGNLRSVQKAFERLNVPVKLINKPADIITADKLLLPGVGHFEKGMENLQTLKFDEAIKELGIIKKKPILGICLGMQLLAKYSEEGNIKGLGLIDAEVLKYEKSHLKIPHMGWNSIIKSNTFSLFPSFNHDDLVYFVHSYYVKCKNKTDVLYQTEYINLFDSAFERENIIGFQFHPEKSHQVGLELLNQFSKI
jgi:imidazole glycerol-phosphate synthase subunit HisH